MQMMELWHPIDIYNPKYEVSNKGRIRVPAHMCGNGKMCKEKILALKDNSSGYPAIYLYKDGNRKFFLVHRLVAHYFVDNPHGYQYVNHKDENTHNNFADNLEWCTLHYNVLYGTGIERMAEKHRKPICQYDLDGNLLKVWPSGASIYKELGFFPGRISSCCVHAHSSRYRTYHGYVWRFVGDSFSKENLTKSL